MPTYEYECQKCSHHFERFHSMTDKPVSRCPECRGKVKKLIGTGAGIIFKGSGFYETDYKKAGTKGASTSDASKDSSSSSKSESASSDSKDSSAATATKAD